MAPPHETVSMPQGTSHRGGPTNDEEQPRFADSSAPLFNMYREMVEKEDEKKAERWQEDANGIVIFTGLFSAAVATLATVTVTDLKPNPQDTSAFYLENIYQLLVDPNISRSSIPVTPLRPPPFSPPKYVIWVNSLWFLSLVISLTCAMLATLIQQWARRYLQMTHRPRDSPHEAARIRAFFANGIEKFRFSWVVEVIPTLIHVSLFLFFSGLLVYLFNTNHAVFRVVFCGVVVFLGAYLLITVIPIFWRDSPYYSPLSSLAALACHGITFPVLVICVILDVALGRDWEILVMYRFFFSGVFQGIGKMVEKSAKESSPEMDGHILKWTFDALTQDHELDQFFNCVLGFYHSNRKVVKDPQRSFARLCPWKISSDLEAYFDRTWTQNDNLVSKSDKIQRTITCVKVVDTLHVTAGWVVHHILSRDWRGQLSVEAGHSLSNRDNRTEQEIGLLAQTTVALIIANVQESNDYWIALAADQLGKSENEIRGYLASGNDNVLLANLIHITRQIVFPSSVVSQDMACLVAIWFPQSLYGFGIRATLLGLQHDFCALWNGIVPEARNGKHGAPYWILRAIRHLFIELHPGTARLDGFDISSYPFCNNPDHTPDPILATFLPPMDPAHTSPHPSDTSEPGHVTNAPQLAITPVSQQSHAIPATSQHIANASAAPLQSESITTPPSMIPGFLSSTSLVSVTSNALTGDPHSPVDTSMNQSDRPPHAASFSDPSVTTCITIPELHDDIQDTNLPTLAGGDRDLSENLAWSPHGLANSQ